ncbi:hypothetical protein [Mesorhizobium sp.]|nr:hypothetical protein [Mesorhizobium sp.]
MRILQVALIFLSSLVVAKGQTDEIDDRKSIAETVKTAFFAGHFNELDQIAGEYRTSKARTSSGIWKLTIFYSVFGAPESHPPYGERSFAGFEQQAKRWIDEAPDSKSAHIAYATLLYRHAFFIRGDGYAPSVAPEKWSGFFEYLNKAHKQLAASKGFASSDPHWYATMLDVAKGENWSEPDFDALFDEATTREPYYYETYFAAIERKLPIWGGTVEDVERLIDHAVMLTSPEDGVGFYARGYWYAMDRYFGSDIFQNSRVDWPKLNAGFESLVKQYPDAWNLNTFARIACIALDAEATHKAFVQLNGRIISGTWPNDAMAQTCEEWSRHESSK